MGHALIVDVARRFRILSKRLFGAGLYSPKVYAMVTEGRAIAPIVPLQSGRT